MFRQARGADSARVGFIYMYALERHFLILEGSRCGIAVSCAGYPFTHFLPANLKLVTLDDAK